jgi:hypothetical protein
LLNSISVNFNFGEDGKQKVDKDGKMEQGYKYVITHPAENGYADVVQTIVNRIEKKELFIQLPEQIPVLLVTYAYE